jgi:hypothetical protein
MGEVIEACRGTKQGSHISPLLFGWFIEQIHDMLMHHVPPEEFTTLGQCAAAIRVMDLFYADDGTLISCDPVLLQHMLHIIELFSSTHGMEVSLTKTNWVEFRSLRAPPNLNVTFTFQGHLIPRVEEVVYMGILWKANKPVHVSHVPVARTAGLRAMYATISRCKSLGIKIPDLQIKLFQSLVFPVLSYGCQIWAPAL